MSAFAGLLKERSAFLWSDGAVYSSDYVLVDIQRKCLAVDGTALAVTARGPELMAPLLVEHLQLWSVTADQFKCSVEEIMSGFTYKVADYLAGQTRPSFDFGIAGWSQHEERPFMVLYDQKEREAPRWGFAVETMASPAHKPEEWPRIRYELGRYRSLEELDPARYGKAIMSAIRRHPDDVPDGGERVCLVGGHILQTEVSAAGVTEKIIHTWPDELGKRIDPSVRNVGTSMGGFGSRSKAGV